MDYSDVWADGDKSNFYGIRKPTYSDHEAVMRTQIFSDKQTLSFVSTPLRTCAATSQWHATIMC